MRTQTSPPETFDVFNCDTKPVRGMNTSRPALTIEEDVLAVLKNARIISGESGSIIETRGGMTAALGTIVTGITASTSAYRGSACLYFQSTYRWVVALYVGTTTRIYYSEDTGGTWLEMTNSATRLTGNAPVQFCVVPDPFATPTSSTGDNILATDGTGGVRIFRQSAKGVIDDINPPKIEDFSVEVRCIEQSIVDFQAAPTYAVSNSSHMDFAATGSAPDKYALLTIKTGVQQNATASVTCGTTGTDVAPAERQIYIVTETAYPMLWDKLSVTFCSVVLWNPESPTTTLAPVPIPLDNSNKTLWVFNLPYTISTPTNFSGTLLFTWVAATNEAPSANQEVKIHMAGISFGSNLKALGSLGATHYNSTTLQESPGVVYPNYVTDRLSDYGSGTLNGLKLPRSPYLQAVYYAKVRKVETADTTAGVDKVAFYFKSPGERRHRLIRTQAFTGSAGDINRFAAAPYWADVSDVAVLEQYDAFMPDAYHVAIPDNATSLAYINDRLIVGTKAARANYYVSEYRNPFHMRRFTERSNGVVDPDAPVVGKVGTAPHRGVFSMATSTLGADTVYLFSEDGVYATAGSISGQLERVSRISEFGTISPLSIAKGRGKIYYLDTEMQIRVLENGQVNTLSRQWVDDALAAIPASMRPYVVAKVWNEKLYVAYATSGSTHNDAILVWDEADKIWNGKDVPPVPTDGLDVVYDGTNKKNRLIATGLVAGSSNYDAKVYEYDLSTQSQDLGTTNISVTLTTKEWMSPSPDKWWFIGRVGLIADDVTSGSADHTRVYKVDASEGASSASIDVGDNQAIVLDGVQTITGAGRGPTYQLSTTISSLAGKRIYRWWCERSLRDRPPNV